MMPSVLAACFFAVSGICGRRAALGLGALRANAFRLLFAAILLGSWVWLQSPVDFSTRGVHWLLVSGVVGFGIGDVCLFLAYPRIGARLTMLVSLCSAPIFGALLDWQLKGLNLTGSQILASLVILSGVGLALLGGHGTEGRWHPGSLAGIVSALLAGCGQGCGAALSRHAQALALEDGTVLDGISQAFVRTLPGMTFSIAVWMLVSRIQKVVWPPGSGRDAWGWLAAAVVVGPVLGVSCFQWALSLQSSVLVLSITASAPVLIMPLAAWLDGDRPARLAIVGAFIAVTGVILLLRLVPG
jgi:drug/metabolite transporter (DMT)-like permease